MKQMRIVVVEEKEDARVELQNLLAVDADRWNISFVGDGIDAIKILDEEEVDVVVTGINMPLVDGNQLLAIVRERFPEVIRIVHSRCDDQRQIIQIAPLVHRFIAKPCSLSVLERTIENTLFIHAVLDNESIRKVLTKTTTLPTVPRAYTQLVEQSDDPDFSVHDAIDIISGDIGLTANILKHVNHIGLPEQVSDIEQAIALLGLDTVQSIALSTHAFNEVESISSPYFSMENLFELSFLTALFAKQIIYAENGTKEMAEAAFTAGVLHQLGTLVFVTNFPQEYSDTLDRVFTADRPLSAVEVNLIGISHPEIGAHLLALWGLPENVLNGVAFYREPFPIGESEMSVEVAVALGHHFAREFLNNEDGMQYTIPEQFEIPQDPSQFPHYPQWQDECFTIYRSTVE